ncbi:hypothetical protein K402DRAFT_185107 [Aulographum hederae CBS 113979]|uniref:Uncharacterized protein n=1 Tax=Aulographum hederae CBS 113979 TaxID=1176131 RepID=A0A6G1GPV2_9PEZI|nr:hypothetical protein K402DRAFT_185107 [Aulographum hederae CBS 113979]
MYQSSSPSSSVSSVSSTSSTPISIGFPSSPSDSLRGASYQDKSHGGPSCAYPSWPKGDSFSPFRSSAPSAFISDADLFDVDDEDEPYLHQAPPPPRQIPMPTTVQPLPPLYAKNKSSSKRRQTQSKPKRRSTSKPMTPISESPE